MFTPFMTDEELEREAFLDFQEMKTSLQIAFENFSRQYKSSGKGRHLIHTLVSHKTYRTKRKNTWQIQFNNRCHNAHNHMLRSFLVFIPVYRSDGQAEYIFLRSLTEFYPEKVTVHFTQRYKERYLEPNNINLRGLHPAVYFEYSTGDMKKTRFYPDNWTEEDKKSKKIWLSDQGLFVTDKVGKLRVFITFLDQENLSRYKAMIYEEENLMRLYFKGKKIENALEQAQHMAHIFRQPNARNILERYVRRTIDEDASHREEHIMKCLQVWDDMVEVTFKALDSVEKYEKNSKYMAAKLSFSLPLILDENSK